jgi:hypothetical protein
MWKIYEFSGNFLGELVIVLKCEVEKGDYFWFRCFMLLEWIEINVGCNFPFQGIAKSDTLSQFHLFNQCDEKALLFKLINGFADPKLSWNSSNCHRNKLISKRFLSHFYPLFSIKFLDGFQMNLHGGVLNFNSINLQISLMRY